MIDTKQLDAVLRFADWLEDHRKAASLTQQELADAAGISLSYYTKCVSPAHLRKAYEQGSRLMADPRDARGLEGVLDVLESRLGPGVKEEGLGIWGSHVNGTNGEMKLKPWNKTTPDKGQLLAETLEKLMTLPPDRLRIVAELVDRLR